MNVKTDTKEKFTVITPQESELTAIMTEDLLQMLHLHLQKDTPHIILNMEMVELIEKDMATMIASIQQKFYEKDCSFVICNLQSGVETTFDEMELLEIMNVTPTESEAWDIVQMEEIERELLSGED